MKETPNHTQTNITRSAKAQAQYRLDQPKPAKSPRQGKVPEKKTKRTDVLSYFHRGRLPCQGLLQRRVGSLPAGKDPPDFAGAGRLTRRLAAKSYLCRRQRSSVYFSVHQARFSSGTRTLISWFLTPTRALAGMECVTKAEPPMMDPAPTTVSPPKTDALE